ncbi:filaggrin isoform X2 [Cinnamomum micranthum f. kanehirae]|uniref:Filaggrin isoform X2 n=1 Tax=Cinnamomum micranthum f. kanehirae TaxID=337451 RepID=A0A443NHY7_9MAGN|nr:filaggrin isoform X2 [Cinnamomum micranthum f. kanehirae]
MLSKSFKTTKCKTSLKLAGARIKLLKNKREAQLKQMKRDLAQLLASGQEKTARIRVEHVVREEKTMAAYDIVEVYCELIVARLHIIESQKNCPIDLKEPIASLIFASPRCADIPELQDVRKQFTKKYGKEFVASALELRPDCGVNHMIIEKLSAKTPDGDTKIKILTAIAQEHNVKWDPAALEEQLLKPREDLLNGPSKFVSASNMHLDTPNIQVQLPPNRKDEPATRSSENDVTISAETSRPVSANMDAFVPMPSTSHSDPRASGGITAGKDFRQSFSEDVSLDRRNWNMKFKDATSAAQAAAESAEMASMAARAAAELARHGKVTREYSAESHASSFHGPRNKGPGRSTERTFRDEYVEEDSARRENGSPRSSIGVKPRIPREERDETGQDLPSRAAESKYDDYESTNTYSSGPVSSHSKAASINDDISMANHQNIDGFSPKSLAGVKAINQNWQGENYEKEDSIWAGSFKKQSSSHTSTNSGMDSLEDEFFSVDQKTDGFSQKGFSEVGSLNMNRQNTNIEVDDHGVGSIPEHSSDSALYNSSKSPIGSNDIWDLNVQSYDIEVNQFSTSTGQENTERSTEKPALSSYSPVVFDESDSDFDTHLDLESDNYRHHFDSDFPHQGAPSSSHLTATIEPLSSNQGRSKSLLEDSSRIFVESTEKIADVTVPSQSDELLGATFDDSDGLNSESEEEGDTFKLRERMKSSCSPGKENVSTGILSSFKKKEEPKGLNPNAWSHSSSDSESDGVPSKSNQEATLNVAGGSWKRYDTGDLRTNRPSPSHTSSPGISSDLAQEAAFSSVFEDQQLLQRSRLPSDKEIPNKDKFDAESSPPRTKDSELLYNLRSEDGNELNYGRLKGGLRNKGFSRPLYVKGHFAKSSFSSTEQMEDETPTAIVKPTILSSDKSSVSSEACDNELYSQKPHVKVDKESSSNPKTFFDSDSDDGEVRSLQTFVSRGRRGVILSRRTRDPPTQSETGSRLKFSGRSEVPVSSNFGMESELSKLSSSGDYLSNLANRTVSSENMDNVKLTLPNSPIEQSYKLDAAMIEKSIISSPDKKSVYPEAHENRLNNQKASVNALRESILTTKSDPDSDIDDSELLLSRQTAESRGHRDAMLFHRTRDSPSQSDSPQKFSGRSEVPVSSDFGAGSRFSTPGSSVAETLSKPLTKTVSGNRQNSKSMQPNSSIQRPSKFLPPAEFSIHKESMQSSQPSSFSEQPSKPSSRTVISGRDESMRSFQPSSFSEQPPKPSSRTVTSGRDESQKSSSSSGGSTSRESSLKTASHVHPKLPDYDTLAAHLGSLRSDRRSQ